MRKLIAAALTLMVGAILGVVVGVVAARLSHVSTFILLGPSLSEGPFQAFGFRRSTQSMVTLAVVYGVIVALVVVVVAACFRIRVVRDSSRGNGLTLVALGLIAGGLVSSAAVVLAHYGSYTAVIRAGQVVVVRPSWLPSLPIAIGIGAVLGAVCARALQSAGVRLVSGKNSRRIVAATSAP